MALFHLMVFLVAFLSINHVLEASEGDAEPIYRACVEHCEKTGCVQSACFQHCNFTSGGWNHQEPLYLRWKQWDCRNVCRYHCMLVREEERKKLGVKPVKYHGKWPFRRVYGIQEPVSVALSTLNLAMQFHGWISFSSLYTTRCL
ncbi:hypothetical protein Nepgr_010883 [Nepenthes gracilis]|uniref:Post-GPI attachment to proteins factor 3 n=1 Tax=Nepenthes gracilis TaxID=150966 RepID=A0AAD3XLF5_NEPGR|nr:hypothetical protein Nepgr_010883 [Nepenthes gracilis]